MPTADRSTWVLALTGLASLMVGLDAFVVTTALPTIQADLHASGADLEWTVNAYTLTFAVLLMAGAALGDRHGRNRVFRSGLLLFAAASAACAFAPAMGWLIAARAIQGAGAALVMPMALALLTAAFAPADRPRALGTFGAITAVAVVLGPLVGGAVVQSISWPWVFWINVPIAAIIVVGAGRRIEESHGPAAPIDGPGLLLVSGAALGVVWALVRADTAGWTSAEVLATGASGLALLAGFVAWESRTAAPMIPLRLWRSPRFAAGNVGVFVLWGAGFGSMYFMTQFLQEGLGDDPVGAGLRLAPWGIAPMFLARRIGRLVGKMGERPFLAGGMALIVAGNITLAVLARTHLPYGELAPILVVNGTGVAMAIVAAQSATLSSVQLADIGKASGTFNMLRQLGGSLGIAVLGAVFAAHGGYAGPADVVAGFGPAMGAAAGLSTLGILAGLVIPARRPAPALLVADIQREPAEQGT